MDVLSIGNSFSQDAQRYPHQIARAAGVGLTTVNLYIGGCSLDRHFRNMYSESRDYGLEVNGILTGFNVSIKEALLNREWDVVTFQQCSPACFKPETFSPYLEELSAYVKKYAPTAKQMIHQTWGYADGYERLLRYGFGTHEEMFLAAKKTYADAAKKIGAGVIPAGEMVAAMLRKGVPAMHRDGFHLHLGIGRYAVGALWFSALTGKTMEGNSFRDLDLPVSEDEVRLVCKTVPEVLSEY